MPASDAISRGLDEAQAEAVYSGARRILVVASPGSGKTRVLSARFSRLVGEGVSPSGLLAITFTNRAAREMKERIASATGLLPSSLDVGTFHGVCLKMLKRLDPGVRLLGRADAEDVLKALGVKDPSGSADMISGYKNGVYPDPSADDLDDIRRYAERLKDLNALDLDDLVPETAQAIEDGRIVPSKREVMVDEYQDINSAQARLVRLLAGVSGHITAIGDPDQAIYAFRGANLGNFLGFERDFPDARVVRLSRNYRSLSAIVEASRSLIGFNGQRLDNRAEAVNDGGEVRHVVCGDERAEAGFITGEIELLMGGLTNLTAGDSDYRFSDFAVLFRTNRQADSLEEAFGRSSIPYSVIRPAGAPHRALLNRLRSTPVPEGVSLAGFIMGEGRSIGVDADTLDMFAASALRYGGASAADALEAFIEEMLISGPADSYDIKADRVSLMTMHTAKGLEFRTVFIAGVEEGLSPLAFKGVDIDIEEERRLFYVGMTRARERLYLTEARRRRVYGEDKETRPSRFLGELPQGLLKTTALRQKEAKRRPVQKGLF